MKKIDIEETWNNKQPFSSLVVSQHKGDKPIEWVMMKKIFVGPEWYQVFSNIKGMKMNWLLRLWAKINNLV